MRYSAALLLVALCVMTSSVQSAEQVRRRPVVGQLYYTTPALAKPADDAFREALRELGYVDGRKVTLFTLYAEGNEEQIRPLVNKMVSANVDVMVVSSKAAHAATQATKTIPIVSVLGDPLRSGLVQSLARPGGNFTGMSVQSWDLDTKRLEILTGMMPGLNRALVLYDANFVEDVEGAREFQTFARGKGVSLRLAGVRTTDEIRWALADIERSGEKALIVYDNPFTACTSRPSSTWRPIACPLSVKAGAGPRPAHCSLTRPAHSISIERRRSTSPRSWGVPNPAICPSNKPTSSNS
jgi:putative ABC transport system substrate-binding protein